MTLMSKAALVGLSGAILATSMPAEARPHHQRHRDKVDAGDVIAGALILGGIAAIASSANKRAKERARERYEDDWDHDGWSTRTAVEQCVRAAEWRASRYGGWARITDVTQVERVRGGYEVRGRLVVEQPGYRGQRSTWGDGWNRDDRWGNVYDRYGDGYDKGRFSCLTQYGRVADIGLSGLRG